MSDAPPTRLRLIGPVRIEGPGTVPLADREAAAARRLLALLALEANPLTLDHLASRLLGDDADGKRPELAAEVRRARSAIGRALGEHSDLLETVRPGETMLAPELIAGADLLELYAAHAEGRRDDVRRLLPASGVEVLSGVSEFSYVFGQGGAEMLRMDRLVAEHRARVAAIRAEHDTRPPSHIKRSPRRRSAVLVAAALALAVGIGVLVAGSGGHTAHDARGGRGASAGVRVSHTSAGTHVVIVVDNRVTSAMRMSQDRTPVTLSSRPDVYCGLGQCVIAGTERWSGESYDAAVCQTTGVRTTNGNDNDTADDNNPGLVSSRRYYGVRLRDGTFGFVSEVWIRADQRGGLGLRRC